MFINIEHMHAWLFQIHMESGQAGESALPPYDASQRSFIYFLSFMAASGKHTRTKGPREPSRIRLAMACTSSRVVVLGLPRACNAAAFLARSSAAVAIAAASASKDSEGPGGL